MGSRRAELDTGGATGRAQSSGDKPVQDGLGMGKSGKAEWVARTHQAAERFLQALPTLLSLSSGFSHPLCKISL